MLIVDILFLERRFKVQMSWMAMSAPERLPYDWVQIGVTIGGDLTSHNVWLIGSRLLHLPGRCNPLKNDLLSCLERRCVVVYVRPRLAFPQILRCYSPFTYDM